MPPRKDPNPMCTGKVKLRDPDGNPRKDDTGETLTRPCTNHAITGGTVCRQHGGNAPQVKAKAAVRAQVLAWGLGDATDDPGEVLLRMLTQSRMRAEMYAAEIEAMAEAGEAQGKPLRDALVREAYGEFGPTGEYVRGLVELELRERTFCRDTAVKAIAAGLAERQVRMAEKQAEVMAALIEAALQGASVTGPAFLAGKKAAASKLRLLRGGA